MTPATGTSLGRRAGSDLYLWKFRIRGSCAGSKGSRASLYSVHVGAASRIWVASTTAQATPIVLGHQTELPSDSNCHRFLPSQKITSFISPWASVLLSFRVECALAWIWERGWGCTQFPRKGKHYQVLWSITEYADLHVSLEVNLYLCISPLWTTNFQGGYYPMWEIWKQGM